MKRGVIPSVRNRSPGLGCGDEEVSVDLLHVGTGMTRNTRPRADGKNLEARPKACLN